MSSHYNFKIYRFKPYSLPNPEQLAIIQTLTTNSRAALHREFLYDDPSHASEVFSTISAPSQNIELTIFEEPFGYNRNLKPQWRPSQRLRRLHTRFQNTILFQHICLPCAYCARLLYPTKAKWVPYDESNKYPLETNFPNVHVYTIGKGSARTVCVCDNCKNSEKRYPCPQLLPIPDVIQAIPITRRRYLSPVFLHCSLGRNVDGNKFTEYRTLAGDMNFSKNMRALKLYSGMLGAFLVNPKNLNEDYSWLTPDLAAAAHWLKQHNKYLNPFSHLVTASSLLTKTRSEPFPTACHASSDTRAPPFQEREIVVPFTDFPAEIHNEDFHYTHLMAGFVRTSNTSLPLTFNDPHLEPLMFPDIFPDGRGHYYDQCAEVSEDDSIKTETYGKYIKHRLLCVDARFRLHPYWPYYSYLRLEKLRNHQNTMRLWRQKQSDKIYRSPTAAELITQSVYSGKRIIDEAKTTTLPTFIRTGDTYFHEKLLHVNAMIKEYGLPSLFITLTMAETKWSHLKTILQSTDNGDATPTNRPLRTALYFIHLKKELWRHVWMKPSNSE